MIHIAGITKDKEGIVCLHDDKKHRLVDGDYVMFKDVKGMEEVNGKQFQVTIKSSDTFTIGDTSNFGDYIGGGVAIEVKNPTIVKFNSLEKSLNYPYAPGLKEMPICNWNFG